MDVAPSVPHRAMECVQSLIRLILLKPSSKQKHHIVGSKKVTDGTKRNKDREKSEKQPNSKKSESYGQWTWARDGKGHEL